MGNVMCAIVLASALGAAPAGRSVFLNGVNIDGVGNNVKEAFVEVAVPVLADLPFAEKLMVNAAARWSDYSTEGTIWAWKVGATWDINESITLRATRSRDVRAASITELFGTRSTLYTSVNDLGRPSSPLTSIIAYTGGNPELQPEKADS